MTLITEAFDALDPDARVVFVADHDAVALRYKLEAERRGEFHWEQTEAGPDVWRAVITRVRPA